MTVPMKAVFMRAETFLPLFEAAMRDSYAFRQVLKG
jgi:hypothetical protein